MLSTYGEICQAYSRKVPDKLTVFDILISVLFFIHSEEEPVAESEPNKPGSEQQQHPDAEVRGHGRAPSQHHMVQKWSSR